MNRIKNYILVSIIIVLFSACEKQDSQSNIDLGKPNPKMLVFANNAEFQETFSKIINMDADERIQWEESANFKSFGRKAEDFLFSIDVENFKSSEQIDEFIKDHHDLIQLVDINGEPTVETVLYKNPYRNIINEDGVFQISNNIYLVLEDAIVSTDITNKSELSKINSSNYHEFRGSENIKINNIYAPKEAISSKDPTYNCGVSDGDEAITGRDRTTLDIDICYSQLNGTNMYVYYIVKPYKKVLTKWFPCGRKISCDIKVAADYLHHYNYNSPPVWVREFGDYSCTEKSAYSVSGELCSFWVSTGFQVTPHGHFAGYDCWGDTHSTSPDLSIEANTFLVQ